MKHIIEYPAAGLTLTAPNLLACGGKSTQIGPRIWCLLSDLIERGRVEQLACARTAVSARALAFRANEKLAEIGAPVRCGCEAGSVVLV